jgi:hypothetical protein
MFLREKRIGSYSYVYLVETVRADGTTNVGDRRGTSHFIRLEISMEFSIFHMESGKPLRTRRLTFAMMRAAADAAS